MIGQACYHKKRDENTASVDQEVKTIMTVHRTQAETPFCAITEEWVLTLEITQSDPSTGYSDW